MLSQQRNLSEMLRVDKEKNIATHAVKTSALYRLSGFFHESRSTLE